MQAIRAVCMLNLWHFMNNILPAWSQLQHGTHSARIVFAVMNNDLCLLSLKTMIQYCAALVSRKVVAYFSHTALQAA
jgi:hypothetical protein